MQGAGVERSPVKVLSELMTKLGKKAVYTRTSEDPKMYEFQCDAVGLTVRSSGGTKKGAKEGCARSMLQQMSLRGYRVPDPFGVPDSMRDFLFAVGMPRNMRNYVAMLKEMCDEFDMGEVSYEITSESTGEPPERKYTVKSRYGQVEKAGTSSNKWSAYQESAELMYRHLRQTVEVTSEFDEESALKRIQMAGAGGQFLTDSRPAIINSLKGDHMGLILRMDRDMQDRAAAALKQSRSMSPKDAVRHMADAMYLDMSFNTLTRTNGDLLQTVVVKGCTPVLTFVAERDDTAAKNAVAYIRRVLRNLSAIEEGPTAGYNVPANEAACITHEDALVPELANAPTTAEDLLFSDTDEDEDTAKEADASATKVASTSADKPNSSTEVPSTGVETVQDAFEGLEAVTAGSDATAQDAEDSENPGADGEGVAAPDVATEAAADDTDNE